MSEPVGVVEKTSISSNALMVQVCQTSGWLEAGTGDGLLRYLYSRFLKEGGELLNNKELANMGRRYHEI